MELDMHHEHNCHHIRTCLSLCQQCRQALITLLFSVVIVSLPHYSCKPCCPASPSAIPAPLSLICQLDAHQNGWRTGSWQYTPTTKPDSWETFNKTNFKPLLNMFAYKKYRLFFPRIQTGFCEGSPKMQRTLLPKAGNLQHEQHG